jgi:predicted ArsR family transcriptional regulator
MSEQSSLLRQWVLLRTLSARHTGASIKELAEELAVCEKTVRRDLDTFKQAGTVFWDAAQRAFRKVRAMLSAQRSNISPPALFLRRPPGQ